MEISSELYAGLHASASYFAAIALCVTGVVFSMIQGRTERAQNRLFIWILIDIIVSCVSGIATIFLTPWARGAAAGAKALEGVDFVYFLSHTLLCPLFFFYILVVSASYATISRRVRTLFLAPIALCEVLVLLNPFTKWVYHYDDAGNFVRGFGESVIYVSAAVYFVLSLFYVVRNREAIPAKRRSALFFFYGIVVVGLLIQMLNQEIRTELFAEALALIGIMLVFENEDDRLDGLLGVYNRNALRTDLDTYVRTGRRFHAICVRVTNSAALQRLNGTDQLIAVITDYLKSVHPRYYIYRASPTSFLLLCMDWREEDAKDLAERIYTRFSGTFTCMDEEVILHAVVLRAQIPEEFRATEQILLMSDGPLPPLDTQGVVSGNGLNYLTRWAEVEAALHRGFQENTYAVYYQPVYNTEEQRVHSAEALLRLHDTVLGDIPPAELIPVAEQNGMIEKIGEYVLEEVCRFFGSGIPVELGLECIDINLSVIQCMQSGFASRVLAIVRHYGVEPSRINFEITETVASSDYAVLEKIMKELKDNGFRFSMDEYGIGTSNMQAVFNAYFDTIKIDKKVLWEAQKSDSERTILENIIRMVRDMDRKILVEGVETQDQIKLLEKLSVDYLQGYYFSKPVTQDEFIGILRVTEQARMEERRARAANEAKSSFLANMSHEIRTPINAVLGLDEMILRECKDEKILKFAQNIEGAGKTLLSLINDILDFSKIEAGSMEIVEADYTLSAMLNDVVNMIGIKAVQKNLDFRVHVDEAIPDSLRGDEMRIRQILVNVLNNAVKYTQEGGIALEVEGFVTGRDRLVLQAKISDTGVGIREEDLGKLFDKFQRLDSEKNRTVEGSGLGLAITYSLLNLMGGEIKVDSTYGEGSTFTVTIPQTVVGEERVGDFDAKRAAYDASVPEYREMFRAPDASILVVDDTPMNHTVISELLKQTQIQIDTARSGREALGLVTENAYDMIFLDYRMPEMDGIETLARMKELPDSKCAGIPVVCLTANAISGARETFLKAGFTDYLVKPIDSAELERMLMRYLPENKVEIQAAITKSERRGRSGPDAKGASSRDARNVPAEDPVRPGPEHAGGGVDVTGYMRLQPEELSKGGEPQEDSELPAWVWEIEELDLAKGIRNCGSEEGYWNVLKVFFYAIEEKAGEIESAFSSNDWKNYTVYVHSLKSTARVIGANTLSDLAAKLEIAGENEDVNSIWRNTHELLTQYRSLGQKLLRIRGEAEGAEPGELLEITEEQLAEAYEAIRAYGMRMDYDNAVFMLDSLRGYRLTESEKVFMEELRHAADKLEWEEVKYLLDNPPRHDV